VHILHVLSQHEVTGAETYAAALIRAQVADDHRATVVSDTLHTPVPADYLPMPIGKRDYPQRLRNVLALRRLIRARGVDLVHAHARAASWIACYATRLSPVPLVSSLHILQSPHLSARLFSVYGEQVIAVADSVYAQALEVLHLPPDRVHLVRNGIDVEHFAASGDRAAARRALGLPVDAPVVALVGRLSGHRTAAARSVVADVLPGVRRALPEALLLVVGGSRMPEDFPALIEDTNRRLGGPAVRHVGHQDDVRPFLAAADVVIAGGRSAMEALAAGRPVLAAGSRYAGVVGAETTAEVLLSNFGDFAQARPLPVDRVAADLVALHRDPARRAALATWGRAFARESFDVRAVWPRLKEIYAQALAGRGRHAATASGTTPG
jgi:glycosyltransferase involved in cell wall biosynthesis